MSRRCMTVTSFGEVGTTFPRRSSRSRKRRLACTGASSVAATPAPVTRSMASLGRTQRRRPARDRVITTATKTMQGIRILAMSDLDVYNLANNAVTDELQRDGTAGHDVSDVVFEEELHVLRVGVEHQDRDADGNAGERQPGHASMRADGPDLAAELEALTNDVRQLIQDLGEVPAGALLQQHGGDEELHIQHGYAFGQLLQRDFERQPEVVLLKGPPELARQRLLKLAVDHFQRDGEGMTCAHTAGDKLEAVGKQFLEPPHAHLALAKDEQQRQEQSRQRNRAGPLAHRLGKKQPCHREAG